MASPEEPADDPADESHAGSQVSPKSRSATAAFYLGGLGQQAAIEKASWMGKHGRRAGRASACSAAGPGHAHQPRGRDWSLGTVGGVLERAHTACCIPLPHSALSAHAFFSNSMEEVRRGRASSSN